MTVGNPLRADPFLRRSGRQTGRVTWHVCQSKRAKIDRAATSRTIPNSGPGRIPENSATNSNSDSATVPATASQPGPSSSYGPAAGRGWVRAVDEDAQAVPQVCGGGGLAGAERWAGADQ